MNSNRIRTDILHAVMLREQIAGVRKRDAVLPKCPVCGGVRRQEALGRACEWCGAYARSRRRGRRNERMTRDKPAGRVARGRAAKARSFIPPAKMPYKDVPTINTLKNAAARAPRARKRAIKGGRTMTLDKQAQRSMQLAADHGWTLLQYAESYAPQTPLRIRREAARAHNAGAWEAGDRP